MTREKITLFSSRGPAQRRALRAMADYLGISEYHLALRVALEPEYYDQVVARMQTELAELEELERAQHALPERTVIETEAVEVDDER